MIYNLTNKTMKRLAMEFRRLERTIVNTNWVDKLLQDSYLQFTEDLEKERRKEMKDFNKLLDWDE